MWEQFSYVAIWAWFLVKFFKVLDFLDYFIGNPTQLNSLSSYVQILLGILWIIGKEYI